MGADLGVGAGPGGPGVVIVDRSGTIVHTTAEADAWLDALAAGWPDHAAALPVHPELLALAVSTLERTQPRSPRMRLRTPSGISQGELTATLSGPAAS